MFRLFRQRALRWQLLLVLVEFALLVACVYAAVIVRYWGDLHTQAEFGSALHWRAPLVAVVLILAMAALGLYQVHLRADWLGRLSRQGVAFILGGVALTVLVGGYAQARYLAGRRKPTLSGTVRAWKEYLPSGCLPLPHPSPRNRPWLARNPWFEAELVPQVRAAVRSLGL